MKSGAWFSYGDTRLGQGRENAKQFLRENAEICKEIEDKIREKFNLKAPEQAEKSSENLA